MGTGDLCPVSPAAVCHGRARQSSGPGPCGDCRRFLWLPNPQGQYSGKIRFIEKPGYKTMGPVPRSFNRETRGTRIRLWSGCGPYWLPTLTRC